MTDIYDIKDLFLGFPLDIKKTLFILFILIVFYFFIFYKKNIKLKQVNNIEKEDIQKDFLLLIKDLEESFSQYSKDIFYSKLLLIIKKIAKYKFKKNIHSMTWEEIKNIDIDPHLKDFIKRIYFKEYSKNIEDSLIRRKNDIKKLKEIIKNLENKIY